MAEGDPIEVRLRRRGSGVKYVDGRLLRVYAVDWVDPHHGPMRAHFARYDRAAAFGRNVRSDGRVQLTRYEFPARKHNILLALDAAARVGAEGDVGTTEYPGTLLRLPLWRADEEDDE